MSVGASLCSGGKSPLITGHTVASVRWYPGDTVSAYLHVGFAVTSVLRMEAGCSRPDLELSWYAAAVKVRDPKSL